jgi:hypothetical protein
LHCILHFIVPSNISTLTAQTLDDNFDFGTVNQNKWTTTKILPSQIAPSAPALCGPYAISIAADTNDGGTDCPTSEVCQRTEIQNASYAWPTYGNDVWYSFSFRIIATSPIREQPNSDWAMEDTQ